MPGGEFVSPPLFPRSNMLHHTFKPGGAKYKIEGLSPFLSHFREELLDSSRPTVRSSVEDMTTFLVVK